MTAPRATPESIAEVLLREFPPQEMAELLDQLHSQLFQMMRRSGFSITESAEYADGWAADTRAAMEARLKPRLVQ